jgi:hypothetical protein
MCCVAALHENQVGLSDRSDRLDRSGLAEVALQQRRVHVVFVAAVNRDEDAFRRPARAWLVSGLAFHSIAVQGFSPGDLPRERSQLRI